MSPHDELELLSAFLDGELDAADRARVEAHLPGCPECGATLDALRATVADLKTLPVPEPTPQDSWALRSAITKARRPLRRWQRVAMASAGVAAAAVTTLAIAIGPGGAGGGLTASREDAARAVAGASVSYLEGGNYDAVAANARLLQLRGIVQGGAAPAAQGSGSATAFAYDAASTAEGAQQSRLLAAFDAPVEAIQRCVDVVQSSATTYLEPVEYEVATFDSKPAFLLFFRTTDHYELWVMARADCAVLYFGQAV